MAGTTFTHQTLALPPEIKSAMMPLDPPVFFNQKDGVLPAMLYRDVPYREFYVTHDGGATWTPTRPVPANGAYSIASASDFIVFDGANVYQSVDAGQSWSQVAPNVNLKDMVSGIDFRRPFNRLGDQHGRERQIRLLSDEGCGGDVGVVGEIGSQRVMGNE